MDFYKQLEIPFNHFEIKGATIAKQQILYFYQRQFSFYPTCILKPVLIFRSKFIYVLKLFAYKFGKPKIRAYLQSML